MFTPVPNLVVPPVNPEDIRSLRRLQDGVPEKTAIDFDYMRQHCSPGADIQWVWWRSSLLWIALENDPAFTQFKHGDEVDERLVELFATFPFRIVEMLEDGSFSLNTEEFNAEMQKVFGS